MDPAARGQGTEHEVEGRECGSAGESASTDSMSPADLGGEAPCFAHLFDEGDEGDESGASSAESSAS